MSVSSFRSPGVVFEERFQTVFSDHCDTMVIDFDRKMSIAERVDQIEDDEKLADYLSYEADLSSLTLELPDPKLRLRMTATSIEVSVPNARDIGRLLKNYKRATELLTGAGVQLLTRG